MPVLPLIDLMILLAWTSLIVAFAEKAADAGPRDAGFELFGMGPFDCVVLAGVCLLFALALAARVWVKAHGAGAPAAAPRADRARRRGAAGLPGSAHRACARGAPSGPTATSPPTRLAAR